MKCRRGLNKVGVLGHAVEGRLFVLQEFGGRGELRDAALVKHDDFVGVHDGVETMSDHQNRALLELRPDGFLKLRKV